MSVLKNSLRQKFSQIPNELITDTRLSNGAFRVAAYLYSRPDNWTVNNKDVQAQLTIKDVGTVSKYWQELIAAGWIDREERAGENGQFGGFNYTLLMSSTVTETNRNGNEPIRKEPVTVKTRKGKTPQHINKEILNNTESLNNTDLAEKSATNEIPKKSIEERATAFREKIRENKADYTNAMLHEFFNYWTEKNDSGKKMRFELEKVFEIKKRLATWFNRSQSKTFTKAGAQTEPTPQVYVRTKKQTVSEQTPINNMLASAAQKMAV